MAIRVNTALRRAMRQRPGARTRQAMQAIVMAGAPDRVVATIGGYFAVSASVCLSVAGPGLDDEAMLRQAAQLEQVARDLAADVSLAMIGVEPWLGRVLGLFPAATIEQGADRAQPTVVYHLCDELLFDAHPYQVLGPGHLRRLGTAPAGSALLAGGRIQYAAGDLRRWLPDSHDRDAALATARRALEPCLVTDVVASDLFHARWPRRPASTDGQS